MCMKPNTIKSIVTNQFPCFALLHTCDLMFHMKGVNCIINIVTTDMLYHLVWYE